MDGRTDGREVTQFMEDNNPKKSVSTTPGRGRERGREVTWLLS